MSISTVQIDDCPACGYDLSEIAELDDPTDTHPLECPGCGRSLRVELVTCYSVSTEGGEDDG